MDLCSRLNSLFLGHSKKCENHVSNQRICSNQGLVKGEKFCFRYLDSYFRHGESTSSASQKIQDINNVSLLLQDLGSNNLFESDIDTVLQFDCSMFEK